ncbi:FAD/NAD(P)-binding protein [Streptomyces sp. NBC_01304]|uniref:FAD/NAD(P)-binding protein n=1 Tax=Streptomyces sp. NBC_01304 TaxID=2903818 RepID=UPI002E11BBF2|nr:FAD/NAD(P)-binding protein [Streptomyces sp. NBC_01304]
MIRRWVVVGGGVTGTAAVVSLVHHGAARTLTTVDPLPAGRGAAFATADPAGAVVQHVGRHDVRTGQAPDEEEPAALRRTPVNLRVPPTEPQD